MSPYTAVATAGLVKILNASPETLGLVIWAVKAHLMGRGLTQEEAIEYVSGLIRKTEVP